MIHHTHRVLVEVAVQALVVSWWKPPMLPPISLQMVRNVRVQNLPVESDVFFFTVQDEYT